MCSVARLVNVTSTRLNNHPFEGFTMFSRRTFLSSTLSCSTLLALAPTVPGFLAQTARSTAPQRDGRILVVIQLDGGNDGINTVVPFTDPGYAKRRRELRLPSNRLLKLDREFGLHPAMTAAARLWEAGRLAVVQGVGYPNPSRSHFKSMAIWQSANVDLPRGSGDAEDEEARAALGWLGRAFDGRARPVDGAPDAAFMGNDRLPLALRGRRSIAMDLGRPEELAIAGKADLKKAVIRADGDGDLAAFVRKSTLDAYTGSERVIGLLGGKDDPTRYPATALAGQLRIVARLVKGGIGTHVFYTSQGGYDTHVHQLGRHAELLAEFSGAVSAFLEDLAGAKLADRVVVLAFSEFGRRVAENGSKGTDHGTAGPMFLAGASVRGGLHGPAPRLLELEDGDLKTTVDFRRVYASVLEGWLGVPAKAVLGGVHDPLSLLKT
jgi:uncharacterized protein (DUF1501 family)